MLTAWKKTEELAYLERGVVGAAAAGAAAPAGAFTNFFAKRAKYPTFKSQARSRGRRPSTPGAFRFRDGALTLAKMAEPLDIVWSRPLPEGARAHAR